MRRSAAIAVIAAALLAIAAAGSRSAGGDGNFYLDDLEKAKVTAAETGKDICLIFLFEESPANLNTRRFKREILFADEWRDFLKTRFVPVLLEQSGNASSLSVVYDEAILYETGGKNRVFFCYPDGRPYGFSGYRVGGPGNFISVAGKAATERAFLDDLFAKAAGVEGEERAVLLDEYLTRLTGARIPVTWEDAAKELYEFDLDGRYGYRRKCARLLGIRYDGLNRADICGWDTAEKYLNEWARLEPDEPEPFSRLSRGAARSLDWENAEEYALGARERAPDDLNAALAVGAVMFSRGAFAEAESFYKGLLAGVAPEEAEIIETYLKSAREYEEGCEEEALQRKRDKENGAPKVRFVTTKGDVVCELFEDDAPAAVANFISLALRKHYDGFRFYEMKRAPLDCYIQAGDPEFTVDGDNANKKTRLAGYVVADSSNPVEGRKHFDNTLSVRSAGDERYSTLFYFNIVPAPQKDAVDRVFGRIVEGSDVVRALGTSDYIKAIDILDRRDNKYLPPIVYTPNGFHIWDQGVLRVMAGAGQLSVDVTGDEWWLDSWRDAAVGDRARYRESNERAFRDGKNFDHIDGYRERVVVGVVPNQLVKVVEIALDDRYRLKDGYPRTFEIHLGKYAALDSFFGCGDLSIAPDGGVSLKRPFLSQPYPPIGEIAGEVTVVAGSRWTDPNNAAGATVIAEFGSEVTYEFSKAIAAGSLAQVSSVTSNLYDPERRMRYNHRRHLRLVSHKKGGGELPANWTDEGPADIEAYLERFRRALSKFGD